MIYIPDYGDYYYYLSDEGAVCRTVFYGGIFDIDMLDKGKVFETPQDAHKYRDEHLTITYEWK